MGERADTSRPVEAADEGLQRSNLTTAQYLLWVGQRLHPNLPLYNMIHTFEFLEPVRVSVFRDAFRLLLRSSDALRTIVEAEGQTPRQRVLDFSGHELEFADFSAAEDPESEYQRWLGGRIERCHKADRALFDSVLIKLAATHYRWYLNLHHLIADGWAFGLAFRRLREFYGALQIGQQPDTDGFPQFGRYRERERAQRQKPSFARARDYWQKKLPPVRTETQFYHPSRIEAEPNRTRRETLELGPRRSARLRRLIHSEALRWFSEDLGILALFAALLSILATRLTGRRSLLLGCPFHNRSSAEARETIGLFMEMAALSVEVEHGDSFVSLVRRVQGELAEVLKHLRPGISSARISNAFDLLVNYVRIDLAQAGARSTSTEWLHSGFGDGHHKVRLQVEDFNESGTFSLHFDLAESEFDHERRAETLRLFTRVLDEFLADPETQVDGFALLDRSDWQARVVDFNDTTRAGADSVLAMIAAQTALTPNAVALQQRGQSPDRDRSMTYRELDSASTRLASQLRSKGFAKETRIAVFTERSPETIAAILAILKSGCAFVPLDPAQPERRIRNLLAASEAPLVLTQAELVERLADTGVATLIFDTALHREWAAEAVPHAAPPGPEQLAYVLFTSGSTGKPKGVMIEHRSLANYVDWARETYCGSGPLDFALYSSLAFDLTITSVFVPLCCGATVYVYPDSPSAPGLAILDAVRDDRAEVLKLTPAHLSLVLSTDATPARLRKLILGGEDLKRTLALKVGARLSQPVELYNEYGPTEATVGCMIHRFDPDGDPAESVPIGTPIRNTRIYVVDAALNPCPAEVPGELCVAGVGVARGYQNVPAQEQPAFLDSPFVPGERLYRTGDRACWDRNGRLRFLGRDDDQVKIRGARIELGEVEAQLLAHPAISSAAVIAVDSGAAVGEPEVTERCLRCGLEAAYPGVQFNTDGVCSTCLDFERYRDRVQPYFGDLGKLRKIIDRARASGNGEHDCLMLLSGGKDSTYALCKLVELGYHVLALTLDNGFLSVQAKQNIRRVAAHLDVEHLFVSTPHMNRIFADSLERFSNVCNGCFKTLYTLSINEAIKRDLRVIVTGLARGQMFETRLSDMYAARVFDAAEIDRRILSARHAYHCIDDAVSETLDVSRVRDPETFARVEIVDFYRYSEVTLEEMLAYLAERVPWIRPADTGRSTNCLINDVGIYVHKEERGYHNYSLPYSWDVRLGHKTRPEAVAELSDDIDPERVGTVLAEIGYRPQPRDDQHSRRRLAAYFATDQRLAIAEVREFLAARLPDYAVPSYYVAVKELPLTPNGKVDRGALPLPTEINLARSKQAVAAAGALETLLLEVWQSVFQLSELGVTDNFFEIGGDSITSIQLVAEAGRRGIEISANQIFQHQSIRALAAHVRSPDSAGSAVMAAPAEIEATPEELVSLEPQPGAGTAIEAAYPMSALQEGMLYHGLRASGQGLYVQQFVCELEGDLEVSTLRAAWEEVVGRHSVLRTVFAWDREGPPLQFVRAAVELPWACSDWRGHGEDARAERLAAFLREDSARGFDLTQAPLLRLSLFRIADRLHTLVWTFSHLILDGWSTALLLREVLTVYSARKRGQLPQLPPAYPFRDFIARHHGREDPDEEAFWRRYLGDEAATSLLSPAGFPEPGVAPERRHCEHTLELPAYEAELIEKGARSARVTLNTLFQAAWALLLHRYTGESTVTFGITVSGRGGGLAAIEQRVGLFINTLALRTGIDPKQRLHDWLLALQARQSETVRYEQVPLAKVKSWCGTEPGEALFDTLIVFENYPLLESGEEGGLLGIRRPRYQERSEFPLSLIVIPEAGTIRLKAIFDRGVFRPAMVAAILENLRATLHAMVTAPSARLDELSVLAPTEIARLRGFAQGPEAALLDGTWVHRQIEQAAAAAPDAIALVDAQRRLSYAELDSEASRLADLLRTEGVDAGSLVPILLPRTADYVVAMLAVLKAGAAYVPLDPHGPAERIADVLHELRREQSAAAFIVIGIQSDRRLGPSEARWLSTADARARPVGSHGARAARPTSGADLAYVIYTSGSTGRPKGVMVSHDNLRASTRARSDFYPGDPKRFFLLSPFAFDSSVAGIFWTLCRGGTLYISTPGAEQDLAGLAALVGTHAITHTLCLPALYRYLLEHPKADALGSLETVIVAGEACSGAVAELHRAKLPETALYNEYGPTEMTVWCTVHRVSDSDAGAALPIGRPIANTGIFVVGDGGAPLPVGAPGELVVTGAGLAQGYLGQAELTAARFGTIDPWGEGALSVYRTGDLGRFRPDGSLEFLGRNDDQIKVRGHRIEPAEIGAVLEAHPGLAEAAVVALPRSLVRGQGRAAAVVSGEDTRVELAAFVVPIRTDAASADELDSFLAPRLPDHMRPTAFFRLDRLPRTSTGKVDRRSLANHLSEPLRRSAESYRAPATDTELKLAAIWQEVLKIDRVGANDSFFRLGGDSLASIKVTALAARQALAISANDMFLRPVLRDLAATIDAARARAAAGGEADSNVEPIRPGGDRPPFFGIYGEGWAAHMPPEQPYIWLPHPREDYASVESLAAAFAASIRTVQPTGPYHLGGFSFGGLIALETARQLLAAGEEIAFLGLVEATPPKRFGDSLPSTTVAAAMRMVGTPGIDRLLKRLPNGPARRRLRSGLLLAGGLLCKLQWQWLHAWNRDIPATLELFHLGRLWIRAWRDYECGQYPGRIVVFGAERSWRGPESRARLHCWETIADGGAEMVRVAGVRNHLDLIKQPYSRLFVAALLERLETAQANRAPSQPEEPGDDGALYVRGS